MQYHRFGYGIKGFCKLYDDAIKEHMENHTATHRKNVLDFWGHHGLPATIDAFTVSRRTLYNWKRLYAKGGIAALAPIKSTPKRRRCRLWDDRIIRKIKSLRKAHPNLGKDKIHPLLNRYCQQIHLACPSVSTIGRIIADAPDKMRQVPLRITAKGKVRPYKREAVVRKPRGFTSRHPGDCVGFDTIERRMGNLKRYVMTVVDTNSRFSFAAAVPRHNSTWATALFDGAESCFPFPIKAALSDNGSEFKGAFKKRMKSKDLPHWHTFPKTPRMNPHCERFNRTIQDEFVDYHRYPRACAGS